jgi:hypothetical protein
VEVEKEPPQTVQKLPALDLIDGISPDVQMTIGTAKGTIKNLITCDSSENFDEVINLLDIHGFSLGIPFLKTPKPGH